MALLKYPGGKESELKFILPNCPKNFSRFFEPFVGGGSVYFNIDAKKYFINDKSEDLINLYKLIKDQNKEFFEYLGQINHNWKLIDKITEKDGVTFLKWFEQFKTSEIKTFELQDKISEYLLQNASMFNGMFSTKFNRYLSNFTKEIIDNLCRKYVSLKKFYDNNVLKAEDVEKNIACGFKSAFYMHFRLLSNKAKEMNLSSACKGAIYLFIRDMCYSSMFRYNKKGDFNVPYGGISYNGKNFDEKIAYYKDKAVTDKLKSTTVQCEDFEKFLLDNPIKETDFIFLDPPYDSNFSCYDKNSFGKDDQKRLANYLIEDCIGYFMLVIKNTDFIKSIYPENKLCANGNHLNVNSITKSYRVSFKNRNNRNTEHLFITNY